MLLVRAPAATADHATGSYGRWTCHPGNGARPLAEKPALRSAALDIQVEGAQLQPDRFNQELFAFAASLWIPSQRIARWCTRKERHSSHLSKATFPTPTPLQQLLERHGAPMQATTLRTLFCPDAEGQAVQGARHPRL